MPQVRAGQAVLTCAPHPANLGGMAAAEPDPPLWVEVACAALYAVALLFSGLLLFAVAVQPFF